MKNNLEYTYIWITESLCCTPETHNIINQLYFNKIGKKKKNELSNSFEYCSEGTQRYVTFIWFSPFPRRVISFKIY